MRSRRRKVSSSLRKLKTALTVVMRRRSCNNWRRHDRGCTKWDCGAANGLRDRGRFIARPNSCKSAVAKLNHRRLADEHGGEQELAVGCRNRVIANCAPVTGEKTIEEAVMIIDTDQSPSGEKLGLYRGPTSPGRLQKSMSNSGKTFSSSRDTMAPKRWKGLENGNEEYG